MRRFWQWPPPSQCFGHPVGIGPVVRERFLPAHFEDVVGAPYCRADDLLDVGRVAQDVKMLDGRGIDDDAVTLLPDTAAIQLAVQFLADLGGQRINTGRQPMGYNILYSGHVPHHQNRRDTEPARREGKISSTSARMSRVSPLFPVPSIIS